MYTCEFCKFNSNNKTHYTRHNLTQKHKKSIVKIQCEHCYKNCDTIELVEIHKKNECIEYYKYLLEEKNKEIHDLIIEQSDFLKETTSKTLSNCQYILKNFPNSPNFKVPLIDVSENEFVQNIKEGGINGVSKVFLEMFPPNIEPSKRPFWLVDASRNKFLVKDNDKWIVDIQGKMITDKFSENYINNVIEYIKKGNTKIGENLLQDVEKNKKINSILSNHGYILLNDKNKLKILKHIGGKYSIYNIKKI
jgi:hypothetical protein